MTKEVENRRIARARPRFASVTGTSKKTAGFTLPAKNDLQSRFTDSAKKEEEADRQSRQAFIANLRHELRTPLNAIIGYSEMLLEDAEDAQPQPAIADIKKIHSAGNQLLMLVNIILDPAKIEEQHSEFDLETFGTGLRHDLRTPLNAVIGFSEMLLEDADDPAQESDFMKAAVPDLRKIHSAARQFLCLISDVVNFSKIEAGLMMQELKISSESLAVRHTMGIVRSLAYMPAAMPVTAEQGNLLVVDDNEINRDLISQRLGRQGYSVTVAESGYQALKMIRSRTFDLVLLDIMMPEMNGYQVLEQMKHDGKMQNIPVIMISALDEIASVVRCLEMGAADYLSKPFDPVLLKARISAVLERKRLRDKEQLYLRSLERELEIGREIQAGFLPDSLPRVPGWEIAARFHPAKQVSGDFYDAFLLSEDQKVIGIVIADVCDKGVGAALFMGLFRSLIRAFAGLHYSGNSEKCDHGSALTAIVSKTNDYIARNHSSANMFATIFLGAIVPESGLLTYVNGGHEPPVIVGPAGIKKELEVTGPAVGMLPDVVFGYEMTEIGPGDILVSFTDGITEALDPNDNLYSKKKLFSLFSEPAGSAEALSDRIEASLKDHTAGADQSDDITLLTVRREGCIKGQW